MSGPEGKRACAGGETAVAPFRRVLADNPSPMTGPGTNTFILGRGRVAVIDPGPALPDHMTAILAALAPDERIEVILVTHPHLDHSALAAPLSAAIGAPVYGYGPAGSGRSPEMQALALAGIGGGEGVDADFHPDILLRDNDRISFGTPESPEEIEVLHTPGHMAEHLSFAWRGMLFCGDAVMAWAPSLVSPPDGDMGAYMRMLERLAQSLTTGTWSSFHPAHGAPIESPRARIQELLAHRRAREAAILAALSRCDAQHETPHPAKPSGMTVAALLAEVYQTAPRALWPAAERNLLAHLADLLSRGKVSAADWPGKAAIFALMERS